MKKLQQAIRDLTDTQQEFNAFSMEVVTVLSNRIDHCSCHADDLCEDCKWSKRIIVKAQEILNDD